MSSGATLLPAGVCPSGQIFASGHALQHFAVQGGEEDGQHVLRSDLAAPFADADLSGELAQRVIALVPGETFGQLMLAVQILFWVAAVITMWTGIEYALAASKAMKAARSAS